MNALKSVKPTTVVVTLVLVLALVAAWGLRTVLRTEPLRVTALFTSTVGLYPGSDVQVLGVPIGRVTAVEAEGEHVRVEMELDPDQPVTADSRALIIAPTMVSDRFVQFTEPWVSSSGKAKLARNTVITTERTAVPVEIDELYQGLQDMAEALGPNGANKNGALSDLISTGAANLEGQGRDMNTMIREFGKASATLDNVDENFFATLTNLNALNEMLVANDGTVKDVNKQFADVAGFLAEDREQMGEAAKNLADAMSVLEGFISKNREHLRASVDNLVPIAETLTRNRDSLDETVKLAPILLNNLRSSYNSEYNVVNGRGNLNEVSLWSNSGQTGQTSRQAPPTMLDQSTGAGAKR